MYTTTIYMYEDVGKSSLGLEVFPSEGNRKWEVFTWEVFPYIGSLPIYGKSSNTWEVVPYTRTSSHVWEVSPCVGALPIYGKSSHIREVVPFIGKSFHIWEVFP